MSSYINLENLKWAIQYGNFDDLGSGDYELLMDIIDSQPTIEIEEK